MPGSAPDRAPLLPRSKAALAASAVLLAVALPQVLHAAGLLSEGWPGGSGGSVLPTSTLVSYMKSEGYPSLFALMALEGACMPIPSEVVLPLSGYLVYAGALNYWVVLCVSTAASLVGALVDYFLALWLGRPFVVRMLKLVSLHGGALDTAERWFGTSGRWTVFLARFVPVFGPLISLPAGLFKMDLKEFVPMTAAGVFGWSALLVLAGYVAGDAWQTAFSFLTVANVLAAILAAAAVAYIAYYARGSPAKGLAGVSPSASGP